MKKMFFFFLLVCSHAVAFSQFKTIAEGPVFDEPEDGFARILQMKNGNTLFIQITQKNGLDIKIYDAKHKQKTMKHVAPKYGKLRKAFVEGIFEVNGDAVLMIGETDGRTPVLYRLVLDGVTAAIKDEETVAELLPYSTKNVYAMIYGGVPPPAFYVRKDPFSDNYAVALMNTFESDRNKRIEVIMYGADHKELARAYYKSPEDKYKYMEYIDMVIVDAKTVNVLAYAFNTRASGGNENVLVLATLDKGASTVSVQELEFAHNLEIDRGVVKYNPVSKKMIMMAYVAESNKKKAKKFTTLAFIDPVKRTVDKVSTIFPDKANEKSLELFGKKAEYEGLPQNFFINPDGTFSVVYEELTVMTRTTSSTPFGIGGGSVSTFSHTHTKSNVELGHLAVSNLDKDGKTINSYFIPKNQFLFDIFPSSFYHARREGSAAELSVGDQFKSFAYVNGKDKLYVLFNDVEENEERMKKGKLTTIKAVSDCDGFSYTLDGNDALPPRQFLFGKPAGKKDHNLVLFAVSDYDQEKNMYVTLRLNVEKGKKGVQLVWMEP